jgi:hypothetical protein
MVASVQPCSFAPADASLHRWQYNNRRAAPGAAQLRGTCSAAASIDFFTVPTLTGRVLFVLVVLSHHRRRIVHVNVTDHPTATWSAQQVVDAFPDDTAPRWLHRDRDRVYGEVFRYRQAGMGIAEAVSAPAGPWQNPYRSHLINDGQPSQSPVAAVRL